MKKKIIIVSTICASIIIPLATLIFIGLSIENNGHSFYMFGTYGKSSLWILLAIIIWIVTISFIVLVALLRNSKLLFITIPLFAGCLATSIKAIVERIVSDYSSREIIEINKYNENLYLCKYAYVHSSEVVLMDKINDFDYSVLVFRLPIDIMNPDNRTIHENENEIDIEYRYYNSTIEEYQTNHIFLDYESGRFIVNN